ncbi:hypothetical protein M011DRAFT_412012 [Sporormia fimetaria CBS 119925]|uniref:BZIP domain-containing protein n=1 Tax=Sporormia fimetaria CBS 119925 TaxID=1340428 RepID=A0A6A6V0C5_9PLEO|nr:hypothetical protein M011DRAFT_412012 [Sporormia fimetaria CBS 119925]
MTAPVGKVDDDARHASTSSSSPEAEAVGGTYTQENPQQQKRKGGRKPVSPPTAGPLTKRRKIYATSEERKQRNRQAQAAFRERRTEYIKQLESTIKIHEDNLQNLQNSHRAAADECLMLRYKNSLLERVLLEKGIDVQAELRAKGSSPHMGPARTPLSANASPGLPALQQRAVLNRQQQRRSIGGLPKNDGQHGLPMIQPDGPLQNRSPLSQPTPGSHLSSPAHSATRSPNFVPHPQGTSVSPNFGAMAAQQPQQQHQSQQPQLRPQPPRPHFQSSMGPQRPSIITNHPVSNGSAEAKTALTQGSASAGPSSYYPSPFESHMNQLGKLSHQEYEEQADMIDQDDTNDQSPAAAGPAPYATNFPPQSMQAPMAPAQNPQNPQYPPFSTPNAIPPNEAGQVGAVFNNMNHHLFDPYDPMLDADPFGLTASMHFPTMYDTR